MRFTQESFNEAKERWTKQLRFDFRRAERDGQNPANAMIISVADQLTQITMHIQELAPHMFADRTAPNPHSQYRIAIDTMKNVAKETKESDTRELLFIVLRELGEM